MGGDSRLAYHGVPRIIAQTFNPAEETKVKIK
jgi:hypothetical protein